MPFREAFDAAPRLTDRNLLFVGLDIRGQIRFTRVETGAAAIVSAQFDRVPSSDPRIVANTRADMRGLATALAVSSGRRLLQTKDRPTSGCGRISG